MPPRPAIVALAEQQKTLQSQDKTLRAQASVIDSQDQTIKALVTVAKSQQQELNRLGQGLWTLASMAGVSAHVAKSMGFEKSADIQNPVQPVPEPPAVPPTQTTTEVKTPEAMANVATPGMVPGSTKDVAADATTTAYTPGEDIPGPAFKNLVDVTAPVAGTQGPLPLAMTKTLTDVRVGDPMVSDVAFPLQGPWQNAQRTSALQKESMGTEGERTMAALRLARLRLQAGMTDADSDLTEQATIFKDAGLTFDSIEREIETLTKVVKSAARQQARPSMVPRTAKARTAPSMQSGGVPVGGTQRTAAFDDTADADLFD